MSQGNSSILDNERSDETVEVQVGLGKSLKIFYVNKIMLCQASEYCQRRCSISEHKQDSFIFNGLTPVNFELFLQWINNPLPPAVYDPELLPQEPWLSSAATTWLLGKKLQCSEDFDRYALSQFIQSCAFMLFGPWKMIELEASRGSLRRFSDHWVAWNFWLAGPEPNEYSGLRAAGKTSTPPIRDPRIYDIEHWYSECGKYMRPRCLHDPVLRLERIEEAKKPKPLSPSAWGRSRELRRERRRKQGDS